jgi:membrane protease YdiL (CAAX protease family)
MTNPVEPSPRSPLVVLAVSVVALVVAIVATRVVASPSLGLAGATGIWAGYVAVWAPLLAAMAVLSRGRRFGDLLGRPFFRPVDLLWGLGAGLLARLIDAGVSVGLTGFTGLAPQPILGGPEPTTVLVAMVLAPVIIAPLVEELFFRGLSQRAVARALSPRSRPVPDTFTAWTAAALVAMVFAIVHVLVAPQAPALLTLVSTFVLGLAAGGLVASTRRLGGAVVAHVVFNAVAVWLTWPR